MDRRTFTRPFVEVHVTKLQGMDSDYCERLWNAVKEVPRTNNNNN